jgi:hypothetical protein
MCSFRVCLKLAESMFNMKFWLFVEANICSTCEDRDGLAFGQSGYHVVQIMSTYSTLLSEQWSRFSMMLDLPRFMFAEHFTTWNRVK